MQMKCNRSGCCAHLMRSAALLLVLTILLFAYVSNGHAVEAVAPEERRSEVKGRSHIPLVLSFTTLSTYLRHMTLSANPLVMFIVNHADSGDLEYWTALERDLSVALYEVGIDVVDVASSSETGQQLMDALRITRTPAILFYQGVGDVPDEKGGALKLPMLYRGKADMAHLLTWALSCISPSTTRRVHDDNELVRLFARYPQYPNLPRVLYFTAMNYTSPGFLTLSQHFASDAVFGVVPNALSTPTSAAIAQRYNITSAADLPVLLVLHRVPREEGDEADTFDRVVRMEPTDAAITYREAEAFLSSQIPDTVAAMRREAEAMRDEEILSRAEARRIYVATQLVEQQRDIVAEERIEKARKPVVIADQADWEKECMQLPKKHHCLATFVDSAQNALAVQGAVKVLRIVSIKLVELLGMEAHKVSLVVVDHRGSEAIREYFEVGQNGFPDVVLLHPSRPAKYFHFIGAFSAEGVLQFLSPHLGQVSKKEVSGGHAFIRRMVPKLEMAAATEARENADDDADL